MKTNRTYIPALMGEYVSEDDLRTWAREFFLNSVWSAAPAPLYWLRDKILPKYRAAFGSKKRLQHLDEVKRLSVQALTDVVLADQQAGLKSLPEYQAVRESSLPLYETMEQLLSWSKRFNLIGRRVRADDAADDKVRRARMDSIWSLVAALETIIMWHFRGVLQTPAGLPLWRHRPFELPKESQVLPPIRLRTRLQDPRAGISPKLLKELDPDGPPLKDPEEVDTLEWYIGLETEANFRSRISRDFNRWLDRHIAKQHESAKAAGLVKAPGRRDLARFTWAAKYQVEGAVASDLAKQYNVSKEAVTEGINWVLDLIRLERRAGRRGPTSGRNSLTE